MKVLDLNQLIAIFERHATKLNRLYFSGFRYACQELAEEYDDFELISDNAVLTGAIFTSFETSQSPKEFLELNEFVLGVHLMTKGTVEEKAQSLFLEIDTSKDGKISREELTTAMQRRIRAVKKIYPTLLKEQVQMEMGCRADQASAKAKSGSGSGSGKELDLCMDEAVCQGLETLQEMMKDIEKDIPLAVNQIFLEVDLDQDDFITQDEWLFAWQAHPEFVELMTVEGMKKVAQWASVVHHQVDEEEEHALQSRLTYVD